MQKRKYLYIRSWKNETTKKGPKKRGREGETSQKAKKAKNFGKVLFPNE